MVLTSEGRERKVKEGNVADIPWLCHNHSVMRYTVINAI